jgi:hypothetical protein
LGHRHLFRQRPIAEREGTSTVYDLGGSSAGDPIIRSYATAERGNFHIDRCDVVAMLCLRRAKSGGLSAIASSMAVHSVMATRRPDLLDRLYRPLPARRLTEEDHEALDMFAELAGDPEMRLVTLGDIQFLHNHTILHARTAYADWPVADCNRHLLRWWLAPPGAGRCRRRVPNATAS